MVVKNFLEFNIVCKIFPEIRNRFRNSQLSLTKFHVSKKLIFFLQIIYFLWLIGTSIITSNSIICFSSVQSNLKFKVCYGYFFVIVIKTFFPRAIHMRVRSHKIRLFNSFPFTSLQFDLNKETE